MKNEFTLENTKEATHFGLGSDGEQRFYELSSANGFDKRFLISLNDQTGRGYPTLEWFLSAGHSMKIGDGFTGISEIDYKVEDEVDVDNFNDFDDENNKNRYVTSTHDNRHDLTQMARDEYYSKKETECVLSSKNNANHLNESISQLELGETKQWPNNERIDVIGQNGNNGEHYPDESESPLSPNFESKPVYTQEILLSPNAGWVKAVVTHKGKRFTTFQVESGREYSRKNSKLKIREFDTRTDEEKLRDEILRSMGCKGSNADSIYYKMACGIMSSDYLDVSIKGGL